MDSLDVKKISKGLAEDIKHLTLESNVSKIIEEFELKADKLNKEVKELEAKRANYAKDVNDLLEKKTDLEKKTAKLSEYIASEVQKATSDAIARVNEEEARLKANNEVVQKEKVKLSSERLEYEEKSKEAVKARENAQVTIKDYVTKINDVDALKDKLSGVCKLIKDNL